MNIHVSTAPTVPVVGAVTARLPGERVVTPTPPRGVPMPPVGPLPPNDAERMTRAYESVVEELNLQMKATNRKLGFALDTRIKTPVITVTDKNTGEMVRQIPAESVLRVAHSIEDLKGVLYSELA